MATGPVIRLLGNSKYHSTRLTDARGMSPFIYRGNDLRMQVGLSTHDKYLVKADVTTITLSIKDLSATESTASLLEKQYFATDCSDTFSGQLDWVAGDDQLLEVLVDRDEVSFAAGTYRMILIHENSSGERLTHAVTEFEVKEDYWENPSLSTPPSPTIEYHTKAEIAALYGEVDNTSDEDKPVSTATQSALNALPKLDIVRCPPLLEKERDASPSKSPRFVFHGDSLTVLKQYVLLGDVAPDRFGGWSGLGLDFIAKVSGDSSLDRTLWPTSNTHNLTSSNEVKINYNTNQDVECDSITVYFIAESGAGEFELQVGPDGGAYTTIGAAFDADNGGAQALGVATIPVPRGEYTLNVHHVSGGTVKILHARFLKSWHSGPELYMIAKGGEGVNDWNDVQDFVMEGVLGDIQPHVITSQSADGLTDLDDLQSTIIEPWSGYATGADKPHWLLISRNTWGNSNSTFLDLQKEQADFLRDLAIAENHSFIDMAPAFGTTPELDGLTAAADDVHPSDPVGLLYDWAYIFDKLTYLKPLTSATRSLGDDPRAIVTGGLLNEGIAQNLPNFVQPPWYNEGGVSSGGTRAIDSINIPASAVVGASAYMVLSKRVNTGDQSGQGTRFFNDFGYFLAFNGIIRDVNTKFRLLIGATTTSTDLASEGFGLEFKTTGVTIISHDGTTRSESTEVMSLPAFNIDQKNFMVWLKDGVIYAARLNTTGGIVERIQHSLNIPSGNHAGGATYSNVMLSGIQETSNSVVGIASSFNVFKPVLINSAIF